MGVGPFPRQEFCHPVDGMVCDFGEDRAEIGFRVDVVQLACFDEGIDGGGPLAPGV